MSQALLEIDLGRLQPLWEGSVAPAFAAYLPACAALASDRGPSIALAAALVEVALERQALDRAPPAEALELLLTDLCLARASRLLVDHAQRDMQIAFARTVEDFSAASAAGKPLPEIRRELQRVLQAER